MITCHCRSGTTTTTTTTSSAKAQDGDGHVGVTASLASHAMRTHAFLEDSIEAETFTERLWATHPSHEERLSQFRLGGPWMEAARHEKERYCTCCEALKPVPEFHETRPMRWWMRVAKQGVLEQHLDRVAGSDNAGSGQQHPATPSSSSSSSSAAGSQ